MRNSVALISGLLLAVSGLASARPAAKAAAGIGERAAKFAQLPDGRGRWLSAPWELGISGRPAGGEAELRAKLQLVKPPPYNAAWNAKYEAALQDKALMAAHADFKVCTRSFPALMEGAWQFEAATLPEETLLVFENGQVRHIYTDGRAHPVGDDLWPTALGDSIGYWEGDTLVVDTIARLASEPLAPRAWVAFFSEQAHFTERIRRVDANALEDQLQVDDPVSLASPWHLTLTFRRVTEMNRMIPVDCVENERTQIVDGKMIITNP